MTTRLNTIPSTRTMTIKFLFAGSCSTLLSRFIMFAYPSPPVSRGCIIDLVNPTFLCLRHWQPRFHRRALTIINVDFYLSILFHHPSFYPCFHLIAYRNLARPIRFPPSPAQCVRSSTSRRGSAGTRLEQSSGQCTELCDFGLADQSLSLHSRLVILLPHSPAASSLRSPRLYRSSLADCRLIFRTTALQLQGSRIRGTRHPSRRLLQGHVRPAARADQRLLQRGCRGKICPPRRTHRS